MFIYFLPLLSACGSATISCNSSRNSTAVIVLIDLIFSLLLLMLGLIALAIGTYTDLKVREVPDWVSYGLIISGLAIRIASTIVDGVTAGTGSAGWLSAGKILGIDILWFLAFVIIAYIMFYSGQWGGGDAKLLMGLGIVFASYPQALFSLVPQLSPDLAIPFPITLILHIFIFGAVYGLLLSLYLAIRKWQPFLQQWREIRAKEKRLWLLAQLLFVAGFVAAIICFLFGYDLFVFFAIFIAVLPFIFLVLWLFARTVEQVCMIHSIPVTKLRDGDWIVKDIYHKKTYLCGPKDLGISVEQIALLKKYKIGSVFVKEGIPFVPAFLLATIISLIWGNLFVLL